MEYSIIGKMYETLPTYDEQGELITEGKLAEGFHCSARGEVPTEWEQYEIEAPSTPLRVYKNGGTRFFVFPDEETFKALLPDEQ